ncbi:MAG: 3'(2'),5'-bisphosphate nucleotidase [Chloroflexi bacterium]|nr:3'(2'),5'-bisphosphate nucleotidase [Chloroflexota bacterium]
MSFTEEKKVAIEAVIRAAELCQAVRAEMASVDSLEKGDKSPVTIADFGSQALVCQHLITAFPYDTIVGEEDSTDLQNPGNAPKLDRVTQYVQRFHPNTTPDEVCRWIDTGKRTMAERFWTLDPIDGTKGFLRDDQYAIALALVEHGKVQVAVLGCPALSLDMADPDSETGVLFVAVRGEGTTMSPLKGGPFVPIHVAEKPDKTRWRFVESVEASHGNPALQETVAQAVGFTHAPLRIDSQVKYGVVARGDAALYLRLPSPKSPDYREKIWDHAAGSLIVEEAGGCVTDMHGYPLDMASDYRMRNNRGVIVSNGVLHVPVLEALAQA